jgi:peptide/nickel transport system substrate-binding protein
MMEPDLDKRLALAREAELKVLTELPLLPISTNGYLIVRDPKVNLGFEVESGYAYWRLHQATLSA